MRGESGLFELEIICVEHTTSWDDFPISSSRIRNGEIDREGKRWIPESFQTSVMFMTSEVEAELKDPFGELIPGPEDNPSVAMSEVLELTKTSHGPLIAVGDVTVRTLQDIGRTADIRLIDGRTKRHVWIGADGIDPSLYDLEFELKLYKITNFCEGNILQFETDYLLKFFHFFWIYPHLPEKIN